MTKHLAKKNTTSQRPLELQEQISGHFAADSTILLSFGSSDESIINLRCKEHRLAFIESMLSMAIPAFIKLTNRSLKMQSIDQYLMKNSELFGPYLVANIIVLDLFNDSCEMTMLERVLEMSIKDPVSTWKYHNAVIVSLCTVEAN